jgi:hypothetical protein
MDDWLSKTERDALAQVTDGLEPRERQIIDLLYAIDAKSRFSSIGY